MEPSKESGINSPTPTTDPITSLPSTETSPTKHLAIITLATRAFLSLAVLIPMFFLLWRRRSAGDSHTFQDVHTSENLVFPDLNNTSHEEPHSDSTKVRRKSSSPRHVWTGKTMPEITREICKETGYRWSFQLFDHVFSLAKKRRDEIITERSQQQLTGSKSKSQRMSFLLKTRCFPLITSNTKISEQQKKDDETNADAGISKDSPTPDSPREPEITDARSHFPTIIHTIMEEYTGSSEGLETHFRSLGLQYRESSDSSVDVGAEGRGTIMKILRPRVRKV